VIRRAIAEYTHLPEHSFKIIHAGAVMWDDNAPSSYLPIVSFPRPSPYCPFAPFISPRYIPPCSDVRLMRCTCRKCIGTALFFICNYLLYLYTHDIVLGGTFDFFLLGTPMIHAPFFCYPISLIRFSPRSNIQRHPFPSPPTPSPSK